MKNKTKDTSDVPKVKGSDLNEADFSMLMVNFRSAKLSSPSPSSYAVNADESSTVPQCDEDLITPLQKFHLRSPAHVKSAAHRRRKRTKESNELNLSVAAGSIQRPMVWPARLRTSACISKSLLHPAKLSALPSLSKASDSSISSTTIEKALNKKVIHMLQKNTALNLSRLNESSELPSGSSKLFGAGASNSNTPEESLTFNSLVKKSSDKKTNSKQSVISPSRPSFPQSSSCLFPQFISSSSNRNNSQNNDSCHNTCLPSSSEDQPLVRSCSSEMRLIEETNVNELASYLDDLLHIPRKMSSMAEMMYA